MSLANISAGWVGKSGTPYMANHIGSISMPYQGVDRHYMMGGMEGYNEVSGNKNLLYEYNASDDTWIQRASMLTSASHIQASVVRYNNCGFIVVGGKTNGNNIINDVNYYDIGTNTWTKIGTTPVPVSTSVCGMFGNSMYCQGGCFTSACNYNWRITLG
jgi:N-acetylneuraminic acid mutarotase